jgi:hypothetical protein
MKISSPKAINWTLKQYGYIIATGGQIRSENSALKVKNTKNSTNKTENHFSHYPRSQVDINSYTCLKIAMSLIAGKA